MAVLSLNKTLHLNKMPMEPSSSSQRHTMARPSLLFPLLLEVKKLQNTPVGILIAWLAVVHRLTHVCTTLNGTDTEGTWIHTSLVTRKGLSVELSSLGSIFTKKTLWEVTFTGSISKGTTPFIPQAMWKVYPWTEPCQQRATCLNDLSLMPIELLSWDKLWHFALDPYWVTLF